jgi:hypothetical protein
LTNEGKQVIISEKQNDTETYQKGVK